MRTRHGTAGHSLAATRAIGSIANVHGVLESLAIIAHRPRPMAQSNSTERGRVSDPAPFPCQVKGLPKVGQWILCDPVQLDDEVDVRPCRCPSAANRADHIAFRDRVAS